MLTLSAALFTRLASSSRCTASGKRLAWANLRDHPAKALPTCYGREKSSVSRFAAPPKTTHCSCRANHQCEPDCVAASTKVITVDQCAELLHCTAERVEEMMRTGEIPGLRIGRSWIFVYPDLLHFLAEKARAKPNRGA
ncbi:helix-turn-helix domain-containing protein [Variovorax sp.]|uniref:helix-turn-helix domain-containing protein n=1 Tax=Variovorax sp. TaxID=1871043 RepID=UPI003457A9DD